MSKIFDSKAFNGEVFGKYTETVTDLKRNELLKSGVLRVRNDIKAMFPDQTGGNYATIPVKAPISGDPDNYDGSTNISANSRKTYSQGMVVVGRAKGFTEKDFSSDITGGNDFLPLAGEIAHYWDNVDQDTLLAILQGVFSMNDGAANSDFVSKHTYDITSGASNTVDATSLNKAIQKACGDNKSIFKVAIMNSVVATNLENLQLLEYLKYTDANGVRRDLALGTWNGRIVLVDDSMPTQNEITTAGVYTLTIGTNAVAGDKIKIFGDEWVADTDFDVGTAAADTAADLKAKLAAKTTAPYNKYTYSATGAVITMTMKTGDGDIPAKPAAAKVSGTIAITYAETTEPVATVEYITYLLGDGAFDFADVGVKVPFEMYRLPYVNGGEDTLYTRQRKLFAPKYISFAPDEIPVSPTLAQLRDGASWTLIHDGAAIKNYVNHKHIPIARIISRG